MIWTQERCVHEDGDHVLTGDQKIKSWNLHWHCWINWERFTFSNQSYHGCPSMTVNLRDKVCSAQQAQFPNQKFKKHPATQWRQCGLYFSTFKVMLHAYRPVGYIDILGHLREEVHDKDQRCGSMSQFFITTLLLLHQHHHWRNYRL
jgi:hypothetical protein